MEILSTADRVAVRFPDASTLTLDERHSPVVAALVRIRPAVAARLESPAQLAGALAGFCAAAAPELVPDPAALRDSFRETFAAPSA